MLVEEAGQVLEAHVLGSLVAGSVLHLIMIGDPLQLRPTIANYCEPCVVGWHGLSDVNAQLCPSIQEGATNCISSTSR